MCDVANMWGFRKHKPTQPVDSPCFSLLQKRRLSGKIEDETCVTRKEALSRMMLLPYVVLVLKTASYRKDKDMAGFSEPVVRLRVNQRLKHKTRKTHLDNADPTLRNPALLRTMALT